MNTIFVKYNKTYTLSFPKNTNISVRDIFVKIFDKLFHQTLDKGIIDIISVNNYNFFKNCYLKYQHKTFRFAGNAYFNSNEIRDGTFFLIFSIGKNYEFNDDTKNKIREIALKLNLI
tara:strand:- start:111 stop:461 length:351 start_codon:yes stop_codon:yes gene_type:complete